MKVSRTQPVLSVVIPTYNRERFVRRAVESTLKAADGYCEVIVVDDRSQDATRAVLSDLPIRYIQLSHNSGPSAARNEGLRVATGTYVTFLDSDDEMEPDGISARLARHFERESLPVVGGTHGTCIDCHGNVVPTPEILKSGSNAAGEISKDRVLKGQPYSPSSALYMYRTAFIRNVGNFDERLKIGEDREFFLRALSLAKVIPIVDQPVFRRRIHDNQLSISLNQGVAQFRPEPALDRAYRYLALAAQGIMS